MSMCENENTIAVRAKRNIYLKQFVVLEQLGARLFAVVAAILLILVSGCQTLTEEQKKSALVGVVNGHKQYSIEYAYNRFLSRGLQERQINSLALQYCPDQHVIVDRERVRETESQYYISGVLMRQVYYIDRVIVQCG